MIHWNACVSSRAFQDRLTDRTNSVCLITARQDINHTLNSEELASRVLRFGDFICCDYQNVTGIEDIVRCPILRSIQRADWDSNNVSAADFGVHGS